MATEPKASHTKPNYVGWIIADPEDQSLLESLGVHLGPYNAEEHCFEKCKVSPETLDRLDPYWGRFTWGLEPEENAG